MSNPHVNSITRECQNDDRRLLRGEPPNNQANMKRSTQPEHNLERNLLRFMPEVSLSQKGSGPAAQQRQQVQRFLWRSPAIKFRLPLVPPVRAESGNAHHQSRDQIKLELLRHAFLRA